MRTVIESELRETLILNSNPGNRDNIIQLLYTTNLSDTANEPAAMYWLVEKTVKFREVIEKHVAAFRLRAT